MSFCIVGIHTGIGKTVCSALLCQSLGYDYWKPVQAGDLDNSDSITVASLVTHPQSRIHPERYKLKAAASPHYAAGLEGIAMQASDFVLPYTENGLIIETAGGIMSPLGPNFTNLDLVAQWQLPVILVSHNYLGSINHTLLTLEALRHRNITIQGIIFVGEPTPATESYIFQHSSLPHLFSVPKFSTVDAITIAEFAAQLTFPRP